jgi:hypothetical protein
MNDHAHAQNAQTLFGGKELSVAFSDTRQDTLKVRQFKVKEYQTAFRLIDDEIGLVALACDRPRAIIEELVPQSYEAVHQAMQEVNANGFFIFAGRAMKRASENLAALPPEALERVLNKQSGSPKR